MEAAIMDVNLAKSDDVIIIELIGELDSVTAEEVQDQIISITENGKRILLDMSGVTYMSSAGLRILLLLYRKISESAGRIVIVGLNEEIKDVMSITGFLDFFTTAHNRMAGLKALA